MATQLTVFTDRSYRAYTEVITDAVRLFNEASRGTILLSSTDMISGGFSENVFYKSIPNLVKRRLPLSTNPITKVSMAHERATSIRLPFRTDEVELPQYMYDWINRNVTEAAGVFGKQLAEQTFAAYLERTVDMLVAAMITHTDVVYDATGLAGDLAKTNYVNLSNGAGKFGDRASLIRAWFMSSGAWRSMLNNNLDNNDALFSFGTVNVKTDAEGRPIIITDAQGFDDGVAAPNKKLYSLGLVAGAAAIGELPDRRANTEVKNGFENILTTYQAQWSVLADIQGYRFDTTQITDSTAASDAAIAASANWTRNVTSHKDTAGVLVITKQ